jgi:hypothetical protein
VTPCNFVLVICHGNERVRDADTHGMVRYDRDHSLLIFGYTFLSVYVLINVRGIAYNYKMETRLTRLEAIIPTLATREDLAHLEGRMTGAIQKVETTLHKELTNQTWLIVKWMSGLLVTLLPSLFAAVFYVARYTH